MITAQDFVLIKDQRRRIGRHLSELRSGALSMPPEEIDILMMAMRNLDSLIADYQTRLPN